jgi:hypothetical protein
LKWAVGILLGKKRDGKSYHAQGDMPSCNRVYHHDEQNHRPFDLKSNKPTWRDDWLRKSFFFRSHANNELERSTPKRTELSSAAAGVRPQAYFLLLRPESRPSD